MWYALCFYRKLICGWGVYFFVENQMPPVCWSVQKRLRTVEYRVAMCHGGWAQAADVMKVYQL